MTDEGLWVVPGMVERMRATYGLYHWREFRKFADDHGIRVRFHERDDLPAAFHCHRTVYVRRSTSTRLTARRVWHEMSHIIAFPMNFIFWESLDWGEAVVAKIEKRNSDFARMFPVWEE